MTYQQIMDALDREIEAEEIRRNIDLAESRGEITHAKAAEARAAMEAE